MSIQFKKNNKIIGVIPTQLIINESGMINDLIDMDNNKDIIDMDNNKDIIDLGNNKNIIDLDNNKNIIIDIPDINGVNNYNECVTLLHYYLTNNEKPYIEIPHPLPCKLIDIIPEWEQKFLDLIMTKNNEHIIDDEQIFYNEQIQMLTEMLNFCNFFDISRIKNLLSAKIASIISNKTIQIKRQILNVKNDFTPKEYDLVIKETEWIEEYE